MSGDKSDIDVTMEIIGSAERAALLALSLHEWLLRDGREDQARVAWVIHLEASTSHETLEGCLSDR